MFWEHIWDYTTKIGIFMHFVYQNTATRFFTICGCSKRGTSVMDSGIEGVSRSVLLLYICARHRLPFLFGAYKFHLSAKTFMFLEHKQIMVLPLLLHN